MLRKEETHEEELPSASVQMSAISRDGSAENQNGSFTQGGWGDVEMQAEGHVQQTVEETHTCRHAQN